MLSKTLYGLLLLSIVGVTISPAEATICFRSTGQIASTGSDEASEDIPCDPNANVSACCITGSICISNLYCYNDRYDPPNTPGTCTDQSFTDPACPCPPPPSHNNLIDATMCPDGSYCCGQNNTACCNTDSARLEIFYRNPGPIPSASASLSGYYSSLRLSTKSRSTTISTSSSSSTQSPSTTSTSQTALTPFSTQIPSTTSSGSETALTPSSAAPIISPTSSPTSSAQSIDGASGLNQKGKIATGVAVPTVALLVAAFATRTLVRRRRLKKAGMTTNKDENHSAGSYVPDQQFVGELCSGLGRAELVTEPPELPARSAPAEMGAHT